ncbi:murein biosynthesis integral membrane protein MurJ [Elusimicrobiota bacterium]
MSKQTPSDTDHTVINKFSTVSSATLISRILGYIRDMAIANFFGATMFADAFFVAYRIPNLLRRLLGEGSLSTAFIPVYTQYLTTKSREESLKLIRVTLGAFGCLFVIITVSGIIFAPFIVKLIAPGFSHNPEQFRVTVYLTRIMFPFLMAIGLGAITLGILNSWKMFFLPALAPAMLSICEIFFILFVCPSLDLPISGLAVGVVIGGFCQLLFQFVPIIKRLKNISPIFSLNHTGLKKIIRLMIPAILGLSIMQINSFVDTICATLLGEGSVTHLYYGNRLVQLPLALFGTAVATVVLPIMSENAAKHQMKELKETLSFSLRMISFLIIPATAGLIMFGGPILRLLFERGQFHAYDTSSTAAILTFYAIGLFFYSGVKVTANAFYSMQDTKTPVIIASFAMTINIILNIMVVSIYVLKRKFGAGGLALATSISSAFNYILLILIFIKRNGPLKGKNLWTSVSKHVVSSLVMIAAIYYIHRSTANWHDLPQVITVISIASLTYILASYLLKTPELTQLKNIFLHNETE